MDQVIQVILDLLTSGNLTGNLRILKKLSQISRIMGLRSLTVTPESQVPLILLKIVLHKDLLEDFNFKDKPSAFIPKLLEKPPPSGGFVQRSRGI